VPAKHGVQEDIDDAPVALLNVPAGHGVALKEDHGQ
jgi:hypothetical protein